jgi:hypothetical protein
MFDINVATSQSSLNQMRQAYLAYFETYMMDEIYELYYYPSTYTSTEFPNIITVRVYYKYKEINGPDVGYYCAFNTYDTNTGLYQYVDNANGYPVQGFETTSTSNGLSAEELSLLIQYYPVPISNICFPAGTPIKTNQGIIPIEKINPDVHTIRNNNIVEITKTVMSSDKYLVCFEKDSLGNNVPSQRTVMTQRHKVFYNGKMREANDFLGLNDNIKKIKYRGEILYNVLMEDYNKMLVNDMICETLHPNSEIAKLYTLVKNVNNNTKNEVIKMYNTEYKKRTVISRK